MSKNSVHSVVAGMVLAALVAHVREQCGEGGDASKSDLWIEPQEPVMFRLTDDEGGEALAALEGVRAARGGPNSDTAGSTLLLRVVRGEVVYGSEVIGRDNVFVLHSRDSAGCAIEALSLIETFRAAMKCAGIARINPNAPQTSVAAMLGIKPKAPEAPKPAKPARTAKVVALSAAPSRFAGAAATDLSNSPALEALDAATDETAEG